MKRVVTKMHGRTHFIRDFGDGTFSDRVILPGRDGVRVKVTRFKPKIGFEAKDIVYQCDETVVLLEGEVWLSLETRDVTLKPGDTYHVPAGVNYGFIAVTDCVMFCVFSAGPDGTLPDDE